MPALTNPVLSPPEPRPGPIAGGPVTPTQSGQLLTLFLTSAFTAADLAALFNQIPLSENILDTLPDPQTVGKDLFTARAVEALRHRGVLRYPEFFELLCRERPLRGDEVLRIAKAHGIDVVFTAPPSQPWPTNPTRWTNDLRMLSPTFAQWRRTHAATLVTFFILIPATVAVSVAVLIPLGTPDKLSEFTRRVLLGLFAGQTVFAAQCWMCFQRWVEPGNSAWFGTNETYQRLKAQLRSSTEPRRTDLRAAVGSESWPLDDVKPWLAAAATTSDQLRMGWTALWAGWCLLYATLLIASLTGGRQDLFKCILIPFLNNWTSAAILTCFGVLTFVIIPLEDDRGGPTVRPGVVGAALFASAPVLLLLFAHIAVYVACDGELKNMGTANMILGLLSGVINAISLGMFIGRLDSEFLGVRFRALAPLYLYASLQLTWPIIEIPIGEGNMLDAKIGGKLGGIAYEWVLMLLFLYAWAAKLLLFMLFAWMYHTGRLEFFFLRLRRLQANVASSWRLLTDPGPRP